MTRWMGSKLHGPAVYRSPVQDLSTVLGGVQGNTGYLGASSGLASLIRAAVCIYQRILPAAPGWSSPKLPALWRGSPFYVPQKIPNLVFDIQQPQIRGYGRTAEVQYPGPKWQLCPFDLNEPDGQPEPTHQALVNSGFYLIPLSASGPDEFVQQLDRLKQALSGPVDLKDLSACYYAKVQANEPQPYALAVVGHDPDEICREIDYALNAVPSAFEKGTDWQTPLGSYFTPQPAGRMGGVALVYPGAFNSYPGVGKDLFYLFPDLHRHTANITTDMGRVIHERMLYPRSLAALSKDEMTALEAKLLADPIAMLVSGTTMAILYTHILLEIFKVQPAAAFGYSLGENSMMYATGVWGQGDGASGRLAESDTFRCRLAGPQQAIREYWGITEENNANGQPLWSNYLVMSTPEKVRAALEKEPRVYLTHINTPRQVVIGGDPEGCKRVLADLHCSSLQAPFDYALHCEVMRSEEDALVHLHNWPIENEIPLRMYSAADDHPLVIKKIYNRKTMFPVNWHRCWSTHWIFRPWCARCMRMEREFLSKPGQEATALAGLTSRSKDRPHLSLSMNRRGTDDTTTLVRTLARLHSHRVPMDLSALYTQAREANV